MKFISISFARRGAIMLLSLVFTFHVFVLSGIIPYDMVWGGKLSEPLKMMRYEGFSTITTLFLLSILLIESGILKIRLSDSLLKILLWFMALIFTLNTFANVYSINVIERSFAPVTIVLALFCIRLALGEKKKTEEI